MGTAVLLPQDCLPTSKSRHKSHFSDVLYGSSSSPSTRGGGAFQVLDRSPVYPIQSRQKFNSNKRAGWNATPGSLPLSEQGQAFVKTSTSPREVDGKKAKARRPVDARDVTIVSTSGPDVPVFTILQRPKDKELANELITKFLVKVDEAKPTVGLPDSKFNAKANEGKLGNGTQNAFLDAKNGISNLKKRISAPAAGGLKYQESKSAMPQLQELVLSTKVDRQTSKDAKLEKGKHHSGILSSSKPAGVTIRSGYNRVNDLLGSKGLNQMLSLRVAGDHKSLKTAGVAENFTCKLTYANRPARVDYILEGGVARLRRASTDPQIANHLVGQYRSEIVEIPRGNAKAFLGITRSSSMSCPERWAGPAYSSSPAPSSLPLPKFSLLNQKMASTESSPLLVEGHKTKLPQLPESGLVCASPGVVQGGELDVASATRSLRRMLKLEPF